MSGGPPPWWGSGSYYPRHPSGIATHGITGSAYQGRVFTCTVCGTETVTTSTVATIECPSCHQPVHADRPVRPTPLIPGADPFLHERHSGVGVDIPPGAPLGRKAAEVQREMARTFGSIGASMGDSMARARREVNRHLRHDPPARPPTRWEAFAARVRSWFYPPPAVDTEAAERAELAELERRYDDGDGIGLSETEYARLSELRALLLDEPELERLQLDGHQVAMVEPDEAVVAAPPKFLGIGREVAQGPPQPAAKRVPVLEEYGVLCTMGDGDKCLITVEAASAEGARAEVNRHKSLFYGPGDGAGRWLAGKFPDTTVVEVHEARPITEWEAAAGGVDVGLKVEAPDDDEPYLFPTGGDE